MALPYALPTSSWQGGNTGYQGAKAQYELKPWQAGQAPVLPGMQPQPVSTELQGRPQYELYNPLKKKVAIASVQSRTAPTARTPISAIPSHGVNTWQPPVQAPVQQTNAQTALPPLQGTLEQRTRGLGIGSDVPVTEQGSALSVMPSAAYNPPVDPRQEKADMEANWLAQRKSEALNSATRPWWGGGTDESRQLGAIRLASYQDDDKEANKLAGQVQPAQITAGAHMYGANMTYEGEKLKVPVWQSEAALRNSTINKQNAEVEAMPYHNDYLKAEAEKNRAQSQMYSPEVRKEQYAANHAAHTFDVNTREAGLITSRNPEIPIGQSLADLTEAQRRIAAGDRWVQGKPAIKGAHFWNKDIAGTQGGWASDMNQGQGALPPAGQATTGQSQGMRQIGTSGGKPVYQDAQGNKFIGA